MVEIVEYPPKKKKWKVKCECGCTLKFEEQDEWFGEMRADYTRHGFVECPYCHCHCITRSVDINDKNINDYRSPEFMSKNIKLRLFDFDEYDLRNRIIWYERYYGKRVNAVECNSFTAKMWEKYSELKHPIEYDYESKYRTGYVGTYQGIEIIQNDDLDDGIVVINGAE